MGPPSDTRSVFDRNVVKRRIPVPFVVLLLGFAAVYRSAMPGISRQWPTLLRLMFSRSKCLNGNGGQLGKEMVQPDATHTKLIHRSLSQHVSAISMPQLAIPVPHIICGSPIHRCPDDGHTDARNILR
jgi:hypothetical protein